jgi:serine/threonine protein kinase
MFLGECINGNNGNQYSVVRLLKSGGQAEAAVGRNIQDGKDYFIKRLLNIKFVHRFILSGECRLFEESRRRIYSSINSLSLPGGSCTYIVDFFRDKTFYYVVSDLITGIPFNPYQIAQSMDLQSRLQLFRIIVYSFLPLESFGIIHGDVKPENILLKKKDKHFVSKLIDFESSFFYNSPPPPGDIVGTEPYYSPEILLYNLGKDTDSAVVLSPKSDIFSLGILLFEMLAGYYPGRNGKYASEMALEGVPFNYPDNWSVPLKRLVSSMLALKPDLRPSVLETVELLKAIPDESTIKGIPDPVIFIERISKELALIHIYSFDFNESFRYALDSSSFVDYSTPVSIEDDDVHLHVQINKDGETRIIEKVVSVSDHRTKKVSRPIIHISDGVVSIDNKCDAQTFYTTDGTKPTKNSTLYTAPFIMKDGVVKAFSRKLGWLPSDVTIVNCHSKIKMS